MSLSVSNKNQLLERSSNDFQINQKSRDKNSNNSSPVSAFKFQIPFIGFASDLSSTRLNQKIENKKLISTKFLSDELPFSLMNNEEFIVGRNMKEIDIQKNNIKIEDYKNDSSSNDNIILKNNKLMNENFTLLKMLDEANDCYKKEIEKNRKLLEENSTLSKNITQLKITLEKESQNIANAFELFQKREKEINNLKIENSQTESELKNYIHQNRFLKFQLKSSISTLVSLLDTLIFNNPSFELTNNSSQQIKNIALKKIDALMNSINELDLSREKSIVFFYKAENWRIDSSPLIAYHLKKSSDTTFNAKKMNSSRSSENVESNPDISNKNQENESNLIPVRSKFVNDISVNNCTKSIAKHKYIPQKVKIKSGK